MKKLFIIPLCLLSMAPTAHAQEMGPLETRSVAVGDIACAAPQSVPGCRAADTAVEAWRINPSLVMTLGDLVYDSGTLAAFQSGYDPTWGVFKNKTFAVPGNHEYNDPNAAGYKAYWGELALPRGATWHARRIGSWKIIGLDSNCAQVGGCSAASAQGRWLQSQLANSPRCTLVLWHHPRVSSGPHGNNPQMQPLWDMVVRAGVEAVLVGHDHDYERFAPLNRYAGTYHGLTRQFVVGTGGKSLYPFSAIKTGSQKRIQGSNGVLQLNLYRGGYRWNFKNTLNQSMDQGSGMCR